MKYALVSDIHANYQAWNVVWADTVANGVDEVICLGDIVGYGPKPAETLSSVYAKVNRFIIGNHDAVVGGVRNPERFNADARHMIDWTASQLDKKAVQVLCGFPYYLEIGTPELPVLCVHGTAHNPEDFGYIFNQEQAEECWDATDAHVVFVGHTHVPKIHILSEAGEYEAREAGDFTIEAGKRYIVNAGSVGMPRDGDFRGCYCILDTDKRTVAFHRTAYDLDAFRKDVADKIGQSTQASSVLAFFESNQSAPLRESLDFASSSQLAAGKARVGMQRTGNGSRAQPSRRRSGREPESRRGKKGSKRRLASPRKAPKPGISPLLIGGGVAGVFLIGIIAYMAGSESTAPSARAQAPLVATTPQPEKTQPQVVKPPLKRIPRPVTTKQPEVKNVNEKPNRSPERKPEDPSKRISPTPTPVPEKVIEPVRKAEVKKAEIYPVADSYVAGGMDSIMNFGKEKSLLAGSEIDADGKVLSAGMGIIYLKFDLSEIKGEIKTAKLHLHFLTGDEKKSSKNVLEILKDDDWEEAEISLTNMPKPIMPIPAVGAWQPRPGATMTLDFSQFVKNEFAGDKKISLRIYGMTDKGNKTSTSYASREHSNKEFRPRLTVTFETTKAGEKN